MAEHIIIIVHWNIYSMEIIWNTEMTFYLVNLKKRIDLTRSEILT